MQEFGVVSYTLLMSLIEYKTLILREETEAAEQLLPTIPKVECCACCAGACREGCCVTHLLNIGLMSMCASVTRHCGHLWALLCCQCLQLMLTFRNSFLSAVSLALTANRLCLFTSACSL